MSDGTPRGFLPVEVKGGEISLDGYCVLGVPAAHGMHIHAPVKLPAPSPCSHLWKGSLPQGLGPGTHSLEVEAQDAAGRTAMALRTIRVEG